MSDLRQLSGCPSWFSARVGKRGRDLTFALYEQVEIRDWLTIERFVDGLAPPLIHIQNIGRPHAISRRHGGTLTA
ncbi:hypothetical protein FHW19_004269 [Ochrobactrum anthropi]|nr:hypothetical protein [Brucella anthropi]